MITLTHQTALLDVPRAVSVLLDKLHTMENVLFQWLVQVSAVYIIMYVYYIVQRAAYSILYNLVNLIM